MDNLEKVNAVQRMQDYIEAHIHEPITLYDLSQCAGYSPYHCVRVFRDCVGKTPFDYIRALRLSKSALRLRDDNPRIIDVALDFVFDSHEGFTRAFSREFGITPSRYRKKHPPISLFIPYAVRDRYLYYRKGAEKMKTQSKPNTVFVQVIERPERKLILKKRAESRRVFCLLSRGRLRDMGTALQHQRSSV